MQIKNKNGFFSLEKVPNIVFYIISLVMLGIPFLYYCVKDLIPTASGYYLIHYVYTFDHGFVSRGLVGEIISWFFDTVTPELIHNILILLSSLLMLSAVLCVGKSLSYVKGDIQKFKCVAFFIFVIYILPVSLEFYYMDIKLDKIVWMLTFVAVFLSDRKYAIWLVPVICVVATMVNPIFLLCSMILVALVLLQEFYSSKYSVKNGAICAISYISMIAMGIYAVVSEKKLGFETPREMVDYYFARYSEPLSDGMYEGFENVWLYDYFEPIDKVIAKSAVLYLQEYGVDALVSTIFIALPFFAILIWFWHQCIKNEENKFQKLIYFFCMISPVVILPGIILSWEAPKYYANSIMVNLCLLVYFIVKGNPAVLKTIEKMLSSIKEHIVLAILILSYFAMSLTFNFKGV